MVVFRGPFFRSVWVGCQPFQVRLEPRFDRGKISFRKGWRVAHYQGAASDLNQMDGVNDTRAAAREFTFNCLTVEETGIHPGLLVNEPGFKMFYRMFGVMVIIGDQVSGCERADDIA